MKPATSFVSWRVVEAAYKGIVMLCIATRVFKMKVKRRSGIARASVVEKGMRGIHVIVPLMVGCVMSDIVTAVRHWSRELLGFFLARERAISNVVGIVQFKRIKI